MAWNLVKHRDFTVHLNYGYPMSSTDMKPVNGWMDGWMDGRTDTFSPS